MPGSLQADDQQADSVCVNAMPDLSVQQAAAWTGFMSTHAEIVRELDEGLAAHFGLSLSALDVLARVASAPEGGVRMSDLGQRALLSQTRISRVVGELQGRGLLERTSCPSDSRGVFAQITDAGGELTRQALQWRSDQIRERFFTSLDERQVAELATIWRAIGAGAEIGA
ncbi:MAG TPA: MarR family transcriptional regulator [Solirubrobacteraceae bacterium]|jgi:DNA-binding MarR family transcriptional regulator